MTSVFPSSSPAPRISADSTPDSSHLPAGRAASAARPVSNQRLLGLVDANGIRPTPKLRVLLGPEYIRTEYGLDMESLIAEIECGRIRWAFDLRQPGADRHFLRVWNKSMACWKDTKIQQPERIDDVIPHILPPRPAFRATELTRLLNFSSSNLTHILIDLKVFSVVNETLKSRQAPLVLRESVVRFLKERKIE